MSEQAQPIATNDDSPVVVSRGEASQMLQGHSVFWLLMCGHLETAPLPDGLRGVTVASVEQEIEWQRRATRGQRVRRRLGDVVHWF